MLIRDRINRPVITHSRSPDGIIKYLVADPSFTCGVKVTVHVTPIPPRVLFSSPGILERGDRLSGVVDEQGESVIDDGWGVAHQGQGEPPRRLSQLDGPSDPFGVDYNACGARVLRTSINSLVTGLVSPHVGDIIGLSGHVVGYTPLLGIRALRQNHIEDVGCLTLMAKL